ncbi:MAG: type site-specific deoxyribonuclease, HsdR family [Verrucomicrobiaceae bacterium]|nr:type site-specific deoxyribonuclease, HsdR family [Verrucomicrobiaceae bacterium]
MTGRFQPMNRRSEIGIYRIQLPHWRQAGATYFVTWRLADSLPQTKLDLLHAERQAWLNSRGIVSKDQVETLDEAARYEFHGLFGGRIQEWLDTGMGSCELRDFRCAQIVEQALRHFDGERYLLDAFVIMPNHVHVLVSPSPEWRLDQIMHSWKGYSSQTINRLLARRGMLWLDETWDHIVRSEAQLEHFRTYIRDNPSKACLRAGEYIVGCGFGLKTG